MVFGAALDECADEGECRRRMRSLRDGHFLINNFVGL